MTLFSLLELSRHAKCSQPVHQAYLSLTVVLYFTEEEAGCLRQEGALLWQKTRPAPSNSLYDLYTRAVYRFFGLLSFTWAKFAGHSQPVTNIQAH